MCCTDKALAKHLMGQAGIPTPDFHAFKEHSITVWDVASALPGLQDQLGFPMVVKPAAGGSALGVKFARSADELPGAIVGALSYDRKVLLERYVPGRDLAVSVIEEPELRALPVVEAVANEKDFYDFEARYAIGKTRFICPADLDGALTEEAQQTALRAYRLLGCHGFARVDLMLAAEDSQISVI